MDNKSIFYLTFEAHEQDAADHFWKEVKNFFTVSKVIFMNVINVQISKDLLDEYYRDERIFPLILKKLVKPGETKEEASDYSEVSDDSYSDYDSDD